MCYSRRVSCRYGVVIGECTGDGVGELGCGGAKSATRALRAASRRDPVCVLCFLGINSFFDFLFNLDFLVIVAVVRRRIIDFISYSDLDQRDGFDSVSVWSPLYLACQFGLENPH